MDKNLAELESSPVGSGIKSRSATEKKYRNIKIPIAYNDGDLILFYTLLIAVLFFALLRRGHW